MNKIKQWIIDKKENGALVGIIGAPVIWLLLGFGLSALFVSCQAKADWLFPEGPVLFFYGDVDKKNPFCEGSSSEISSNVGIRQTFYRNGGIKIGGQYTHHSCAFKRDAGSYDALGFGLEWEIGK